jgi:hypothetical protein
MAARAVALLAERFGDAPDTCGLGLAWSLSIRDRYEGEIPMRSANSVRPKARLLAIAPDAAVLAPSQWKD